MTACAALLLALGAHAQSDPGEQPLFSRDRVREIARDLASREFEPLAQAPRELRDLSYSQYRAINYQQDAAIWGGSPTKFSIQLFAPGFLYQDLVDIDIVENGRSRPLEAGADSFRVPDKEIATLLDQTGKYAGIRLHYPINRDDYADEFLVFQGASFLRGVSRGQSYGLSARGLAIDVAEPSGEEHPVFRRFWIERPSSSQTAMVVHALLDSPRVTGAYRFGIYPGAPTRVDVEATLYPRKRLEHVGLGPLTSMFMFGPSDPRTVSDYRPAVHDSSGLAIARSNGERLWRPLRNPATLQISGFMDENPRGFGLIQRDRAFEAYQDLEARYERRPSAWVQPLEDWGPGSINLVEIPSDSEANDNIVAYWRPEGGLAAGKAFSFSYRLTWPADVPVRKELARVVRSEEGLKLFSDRHEMMVDWASTGAIAGLTLEASIDRGDVVETTLQENPFVDGVRAFVTFDPGEADVAELRFVLKRDGEATGETFLHRWLRDR
ncbi:MAG: glucan biosynthesis protein G [Halieaceae bacterium]|nr:glucan biosynthesis protein G [Halieaceae bacterium]